MPSTRHTTVMVTPHTLCKPREQAPLRLDAQLSTNMPPSKGPESHRHSHGPEPGSRSQGVGRGVPALSGRVPSDHVSSAPFTQAQRFREFNASALQHDHMRSYRRRVRSSRQRAASSHSVAPARPERLRLAHSVEAPPDAGRAWPGLRKGPSRECVLPRSQLRRQRETSSC